MKLLPSLILLGSSMAVQSQTVIYTYDNAGNRISRTLQAAKSRSSFMNDSLGVENQIESGLFNVSVHPTLTDGLVNVDIPAYGKNDEAEIRVYSLSGYEVMSIRVTEPYSTIDMAYLPAGVYVLNVMVNGDITSIKIIKQ